MTGFLVFGCAGYKIDRKAGGLRCPFVKMLELMGHSFVLLVYRKMRL